MKWSSKSRYWLVAVSFGIVQGVVLYVVFGRHTSSPVISVETKLIDFGTLPTDQAITREVRIGNRGIAPLVISKVKSGCGCTSVTISNDVIESGKWVPLQITLKSNGQQAQAVALYVFSNDPNEPVTTLIATAESRSERFAEPPLLDFGRVDASGHFPTARTFKLFVKNLDTVATNRSDFKISSDEDYLSIDTSTPQNGMWKEIHVSIRPNPPVGDIFTRLQIKNDVDSTSLTMDVLGYVRGRFVALPQMLMMGPFDPDNSGETETIVIKARASEIDSGRTNTLRLISLDISKTLCEIVSATEVQDSGELGISVAIQPRAYSGVWSNRELIGHIRAQCADSNGYSESLNIPVALNLRLPKVRD